MGITNFGLPKYWYAGYKYFGMPKKTVTRIQNGNAALEWIQPVFICRLPVFRMPRAKISYPCTMIVV
ncbi:MAG: hypothetical protein WC072_05020, partial [Methanoregulaceae archaeon]